MAAVASPALAVLASEPEVLFVRYFLVSVAVVLLLLADLGARLARRGRAAAALLAARGEDFAAVPGFDLLYTSPRGPAFFRLYRLEPAD